MASRPPDDGWHEVSPIEGATPDFVPRHNRGGHFGGEWLYLSAEGLPLYIIVRFDLPDGKKDFFPYVLQERDGKRRWQAKGPARHTIYGLDILVTRPDADVLVVEGEKAADAAQVRFPDLIVVSWPGGSGAVVHHTLDWSPLRGRPVTLWPDADEPGRKAMAKLAQKLIEIEAAGVAMVQVPSSFPDGWDLADEPPEGCAAGCLRGLLAGAMPVTRPQDDEAPHPEPGDGDPGHRKSSGPGGASHERGAAGGGGGAKSESDGKAGEDAAKDWEAAVERLARLSVLDYERVRKAEAKRLGIRPTVLDKLVAATRGTEKPGQGRSLDLPMPEPWPDPVDGADLLNAIRAAFERHVVLPRHASVALALWVLHTYVFDCFNITPRLGIASPERRCGKTTLLDILRLLVAKPLSASNITSAAVFRTIEMARPTLLVDEADTFLRENEELRGVLNSGHARNGSVVRTVGDEHEPRQFSTFAPTALASIGGLPSTLQDRSIEIPMKRRLPSETIINLRDADLASWDALRRKAVRWAPDHKGALTEARPLIPPKLNDRAADNWWGLLAIAEAVGGDWPNLAREAARVLAYAKPDDSKAVMLLHDIRAISGRAPGAPLLTADLLRELIAMEGRPWAEWWHGKPLTPRNLADLLARFGIGPVDIYTGHPARALKGYRPEALADAFDRYLPPEAP
jgi:putative DNA primase/helicase